MSRWCPQKPLFRGGLTLIQNRTKELCLHIFCQRSSYAVLQSKFRVVFPLLIASVTHLTFFKKKSRKILAFRASGAAHWYCEEMQLQCLPAWSSWKDTGLDLYSRSFHESETCCCKWWFPLPLQDPPGGFQSLPDAGTHSLGTLATACAQTWGFAHGWSHQPQTCRGDSTSVSSAPTRIHSPAPKALTPAGV